MTKANKTEINQDPGAHVSPEKSTLKKADTSKGKSIKYVDKSAGQSELVVIFDTIKSLMKPYAKGTVKERGEKPGIYNLVSEKPGQTAGRAFQEIYFASIIIQKGFVGFYFMPAYTIETIREQLQPGLLKCLKGKSCFHIKKIDSVTIIQITEALQTGYDAYEKKGWV